MKSKSVPMSVHIEYLRVPGKRGLIRAPQPDTWYVQIVLRAPKSHLIAREFVFDNAGEAKAYYDHLRGLIA